jgi:hypothetical protein
MRLIQASEKFGALSFTLTNFVAQETIIEIMRNIFLLVLLAAFNATLLSQSNPFSVVNYSQGLGSDGNEVIPPRSNPLKALGTPENIDVDNGPSINFFSLGFGGEILLEVSPFTVTPNTKITIFETTFEYQCDVYPEECELYAGNDSSQMVLVGTSCGNEGMTFNAPFFLDTIRFLRVVDISNSLNFASFPEPADGYDLDGIEVQNFNPLAIHLGEFNVEYLDGNVSIEIVTLSESNSWKVQVSASEDLIQWRDIAEFNSAGNTSLPTRYYKQVPFEPIESITYFRVAEVDLDGEITFYDPIYVETNPSGSIELFDLSGRKTANGNFLIRRK